MTAEPTPAAAWMSYLDRQRRADQTIENVLSLPDDAPRVELRDGVMIVVPSPTLGHQNIGNLLWMWLKQNAPDEFVPATSVGVAIGLKDTLEPDVALLRQPADTDSHYFGPEQVALAVEIVSPGTKRRDRFEKPADYAAARVPHFWRVEQNPVHVFAYELAGDRYELVADSEIELTLEKPFEIRLPIGEITP